MYDIVVYGLGQVAQWIELLTTDQKVGGSNPSLLTNSKSAKFDKIYQTLPIFDCDKMAEIIAWWQ
jgi:hypothetical protein